MVFNRDVVSVEVFHENAGLEKLSAKQMLDAAKFCELRRDRRAEVGQIWLIG